MVKTSFIGVDNISLGEDGDNIVKGELMIEGFESFE